MQCSDILGEVKVLPPSAPKSGDPPSPLGEDNFKNENTLKNEENLKTRAKACHSATYRNVVNF